DRGLSGCAEATAACLPFVVRNDRPLPFMSTAVGGPFIPFFIQGAASMIHGTLDAFKSRKRASARCKPFPSRRPVVEQLEDRTLVSQGAVLVKDINTRGGDFFSSNPNQFVAFQGLTYFVADDGAVGPQIFRTDGTATGNKRVSDQFPGFFNPQDLTVAG